MRRIGRNFPAATALQSAVPLPKVEPRRRFDGRPGKPAVHIAQLGIRDALSRLHGSTGGLLVLEEARKWWVRRRRPPAAGARR